MGLVQHGTCPNCGGKAGRLNPTLKYISGPGCILMGIVQPIVVTRGNISTVADLISLTIGLGFIFIGVMALLETPKYYCRHCKKKFLL